jgi:propionyl-CoA carboxylase beta chain
MAISKELLDELEKRRKQIRLAGGQDKIDARHEKDLMTARERLDQLFEPNTFIEFGMHAKHSSKEFGMDKKDLPADGVVTGTGYVEGRPMAAFSQDFTVSGGSLGRVHAKKICDLMEYAMEKGMPIIGINDSGGARIQEGVDSLSGYGQVFYHNVLASGLVPQIAIIAGPCAGGAAYSPALMDFLIMVRGKAEMFICGPQVIKAATGEDAKSEQFATADAHGSVSGNIHLIAEDDEHAMELARKLLSYLPSNNVLDPPHDMPEDLDLTEDPGMNDIVPATNKEALDIFQVIERLVDDGDFFEIQGSWAKNIVTGYARISGVVVGIIANQPAFKAGTIDIDASDKAARFIRTCNCFNIPIVTLMDVPGFMPGLAQERGGIIRHGAKMLFAYSAASVPKITLILRKAYGGAYLAMCSSDLGADSVFAWPTAEIAVMGAEGAVKILHGRQIKAAEDPKAAAAKFTEEYRQKFASPYQAAANAMITDVIKPSESRSALTLALRNALSKRVTRPPKKHGNIPL